MITDTGVGMTDEVRRRALEPFFTTRPTAAGLGLATTAGIVQGIGGHIELESQPRIGTTVHLYLPAAEERPAPAADRQGAPAVIGRVLIVEDQPEVAQLVQRLIEPAGYAITVATDALTAVTQVAAGRAPRPADHRRGDADDDRAGAGRGAAHAPPGPAGALHVRATRRRRSGRSCTWTTTAC